MMNAHGYFQAYISTTVMWELNYYFSFIIYRNEISGKTLEINVFVAFRNYYFSFIIYRNEIIEKTLKFNLFATKNEEKYIRFYVVLLHTQK